MRLRPCISAPCAVRHHSPRYAPAAAVTVHAHGVYFFKDEPGKKFWSTKDAGQKPLTYKAGVGDVIVGWDQGCLGMRVSDRAPPLRLRAWWPCNVMHNISHQRSIQHTDILQEREVRSIDIPSHEAYGREGCPAWDIPPNARLVFEIEVCVCAAMGRVS